MKKNSQIAIGIVVFSLIGLGLFAFSGITFEGFGAASEATFDDIKNNNCQFAVKEKYTLSCSASGNAIENSVNIVPNKETSYKVITVESRIESVIFKNDPDIFKGIVKIEIWNNAKTTKLCEVDTGKNIDTCTGLSLRTGIDILLFVPDRGCKGLFSARECGNSLVEVNVIGRTLFLKYSDARGSAEIDLPGTNNCIFNRFIAVALPEEERNRIASAESVTLEQGQARDFAAGAYISREMPNVLNYNGKPAVCDFPNKKVVGYSKVQSLGGQNYCIQDSSRTLFDGSNEAFCCSDNQCQTFYGLSSDFKCNNFVCQSKKPSTVQCTVDDDCSGTVQTGFFDQKDGTTVKREASCQNNVCVPRDIVVGCNPLQAYPNNQCCKKDTFGNYQLQQCTQTLNRCEELGSDACCLPNNKQGYTIKSPKEGQQCCDSDGDGIGYSANECTRKIPELTCAKEDEVLDVTVVGGLKIANQECCNGLEPKLVGDKLTCKKSDKGFDLGDLLLPLIILIMLVVAIIAVALVKGKKR